MLDSLNYITMAQLKTRVKCKKDYRDRDGQCFTKGKEYEGNICNVLENLQVTNDLGQDHVLGNLVKYFKKI
jgi:hypothetical protein